MNEKNPVHILASISFSWCGTIATAVMANLNIVLAVLCGAASLVASVYAILVSRATLKLRNKQIADPRHYLDTPNINNAFVLFLGLSFMLAGCTFQGRSLSKADDKLREESRVLTTAVVDTLVAQPTERRDAYTSTALVLAKQDQKIEGIPAHPLDIAPLVASNATAIAGLQARFDRQNAVIQKQNNAIDRLVAYGEQFEKEKNKSLLRRVFASLGLLGSIAAVVALCVFFPVAIPILGQLLGWIVSKLPGLARTIGVVSHKAYAQVVAGVEEAKEKYKEQGKPDVVATLNNALRGYQSPETEKLVAHTKAALP